MVSGANVHGIKLLSMTLESVAMDRPEGGDGEKQDLCLDKGYGNPTGREAVETHGYRGHIRRKGEAGRRRGETLSGPAVGRGAHPGLAVQAPCHPGALRQEGVQLYRPAPVGLRPAPPPPTATQV